MENVEEANLEDMQQRDACETGKRKGDGDGETSQQKFAKI